MRVRVGHIGVVTGNIVISDFKPPDSEFKPPDVDGTAVVMVEARLPEDAPEPLAHMTFTTAFPGTILKINLRPGIAWIFRAESLIAASSSVHLEQRFNIDGDNIFDDQVMDFTRASVAVAEANANASTEAPSVYIASLGQYHCHASLSAQDTLAVNTSLFLAAPEMRFEYDLVSGGGSIFSAMAARRQSFMLRFRGPCYVLTQSHSLASLASHLKHETSGEEDDKSSYAQGDVADDSLDEEDDASCSLQSDVVSCS